MAEIKDVAGGTSAFDAVSDVFGSAGAAAASVVPGAAMVSAAAAAAGAAAKASGGGSGSWSFDREQINTLIGKWKKLRDDCQNDGMDLQQLSSILGAEPSEDSPSVKYSSLVAEGVGSIRESNISMVKYIDDFIEKLEAARDGIQRTEDASTDPFQAAKSVFGA